SVGAHIDDMVHGHAAFAIDFGQPTESDGAPCFPATGRPCLGHRLNLMGFDNDPGRRYPLVGVGVSTVTGSTSAVGPKLVTIDFAIPSSGPDHFVTGVVYDDANGNGAYDAG